MLHTDIRNTYMLLLLHFAEMSKVSAVTLKLALQHQYWPSPLRSRLFIHHFGPDHPTIS